MSKYTADDFAKAEFARHPKGGRAMACARSGRKRWINVQGGELSDAQMAEKGWSPVRGCPDPEQHYIANRLRAVAAATPCSCSAQTERAEKAERAAQTLGKVIEDQCRDIARITRSEHLVDEDGDADWGAIWERGHDMAQRLHDAEARIDELRDQVGLAVREKDEWEANATQPRGFTAEDITDEMVERAWRKSNDITQDWGLSLGAARDVLVAALTEPTRPEWEDAPAVIAVCNGSMTPRVFSRGDGDMWNSDHYSAHTHQLRDVTPLYPSGVRVTGDES